MKKYDHCCYSMLLFCVTWRTGFRLWFRNADNGERCKKINIWGNKVIEGPKEILAKKMNKVENLSPKKRLYVLYFSPTFNFESDS